VYLSFYGLKEEPFRLTPDPRFLHLAEPHRTALMSLVNAILLRKGIAVVTGPVGTGKTTILHATLHLLSSRAVASGPNASAFLLNPTLSREELLEAILEEFEVSCPTPSKPRRLMALHHMLLDTQRRGGTAVLIVDEAHLLSPELLEEIRLLSNTDSYREKLLQIILCGQPELLPLLAQPELRALQQRVASRCHLRALSHPETRAYVAERLHAAGLKGASPFSGAALDAIFDCTQGNPRLINLVCDAALTMGWNQGAKQFTPEMIEEAAGREWPIAEPMEPVLSRPVAATAKSDVSGSTVDILIKALKQGRTSARSET